MTFILIEQDGVRSEVDESLLVKKEFVAEEDDDRKVDVIEYRFPHSDVIVHRSVHVTAKRWPQEMQATSQGFTS